MAALEIPEGIKEFLRKDNARDLLGEVERGNLDVNALYSLSAGRSLLHDACLLGAPYCCKALLALDASPNIQVLPPCLPLRALVSCTPHPPSAKPSPTGTILALLCSPADDPFPPHIFPSQLVSAGFRANCLRLPLLFPSNP